MAKKVQLRVHKLAKELGISSKDVIAKCEAEGIPGIENHLSPVSIGLAPDNDAAANAAIATGGVIIDISP